MAQENIRGVKVNTIFTMFLYVNPCLEKNTDTKSVLTITIKKSKNNDLKNLFISLLCGCIFTNKSGIRIIGERKRKSLTCPIGTKTDIGPISANKMDR